MADLSWPRDVLVIAAVGTVALLLLSYWWSAVMSRRGWSWQVKAKPKRRQDGPEAKK